MSTEEPPPQWMIELEDRLKIIKEQRQLGHEVGAGSRCIKCVNKCPGLDLHFWRKQCLNCRCKSEDHDIPTQDNNRIRFEILLSKDKNSKFKSNAAVLEIKLKQQVKMMPDRERNDGGSDDLVFDWVPPDVSKELATDYMDQLPVFKLPIKGTAGARYRNVQLEKQIPLYDFSPEKIYQLNNQERKRFELYLQNVRDNVVGQAEIKRICLANKQFAQSEPYGNVMPRPNFTSVPPNLNKEFSIPWGPDHSHRPVRPVFKNPVSGLRFPSIQNVPVKETSQNNSFEETDENSWKKFRPHESSRFHDDIPLFVRNMEELDISKIENDCNINSGDEANQLNLPTLNLEDTEFHTPFEFDNNTGLSVPSTSVKDPHHLASTEAKADIVNDPANNNSLIQVPGFQPLGSRHIKNNPAEQTCEKVGENLIVDKLMDCNRCKKIIPLGSVAILAERAGKNVAWHPTCFVCAVCQELLADLVYFYHLDNVYCGRHYAEKCGFDRCSSCDELLFGEYTIAEGKSYHVNHFCCSECDKQLGGLEYLLLHDEPKCLDCYDRLYGKKCHTCGNPIQAHDCGVQFGGIHWHDVCFQCKSCSKKLLKMKFIYKENYRNIFCSNSCVNDFVAKETEMLYTDM